MAPGSAAKFIESKIRQKPVTLFSKSCCPDSRRIKRLLEESYSLKDPTLEIVDIERRQDVNQLEDYFMVMCLSERRQLPQLYVDGTYVGNEEKVTRLHDDGSLEAIFIHAGVIESPISKTNRVESAGSMDESTTFYTSGNSEGTAFATTEMITPNSRPSKNDSAEQTSSQEEINQKDSRIETTLNTTDTEQAATVCNNDATDLETKPE